MILLSAITPAGPRLAVKTASGIVILETVGKKTGLPLTMEEIFLIPDALDRVRDFIDQNLVDCVNSELAVPEKECRIGLPFRPRNLLCIGLNYKDHQAGQEPPLPAEPVIFAKLTGCVAGPNQPIVLPAGIREVGYEAELGVVIGRECRRVSASDALDYVAGYTCLNDVGARDLLRSDGQLVRAKSQDSFGPMGPYLVSREDIPDPQTLPIRSWVNGQLLQDSNTNQMIFGVRELIAYISGGITLGPGDVISTGTPPRVGSARKEQVFLKSGDEVVVEVQGVGRLSNPVRAQGDAITE
jgi:2-keto-4-pentenoate hydratase/2-oxohepta-3-ene-1,7-dioic acid hydratase in catechol pathway